ncbi:MULTISPECIES: hypothetical protein [Rhodococcus]|uniref:hypothetical protein n=1 Tax=Rhodococcus TaxID=1827 RepID=UPI00187840D0|nr:MULTISPECIES: hypothetical protein [Rhodococcus]QOS66248.1 hypothetical protein IM699_28940 [Rhodococcus qingshengii]
MSFVNKFRSFVNTSGGSDSDAPSDSSSEGEDFDYSSIDNCPYCRTALQGWGCVSCDVEFALEGDRLVERLLSEQGPQTERRCTGCDTPLKSGYFTAAWEDGDNADAYITCPSCGYQNIF